VSCEAGVPRDHPLRRVLPLVDAALVELSPAFEELDRVKNDRRDAVTLAQNLRAGYLVEVWVPDEAHEAMRDALLRGHKGAQNGRCGTGIWGIPG
jgi:hypothetical protein